MQSIVSRIARIETAAQLRELLRFARARSTRIGFVPTMGALHEGHLSLIRRACEASELVVVSVFVNPLQFAPNEDFARYPRQLEEDEQLAQDAGAQVLFAPAVKEMYPAAQEIRVTAGEVGRLWEGEFRPGHFDGVLTAVAKLLNIVQPDIAVFGQKDLQQAVLVEAMVRDLNLPVAIDIGPTVRDADGLAMSSRNRYLTDDERRQALVLHRALSATLEAFNSGERRTSILEQVAHEVLCGEPDVEVQYFAVVERRTLQSLGSIQDTGAAIVAARVGSTRLIDNVLLGGA